jgi:hypothetical protein
LLVTDEHEHLTGDSQLRSHEETVGEHLLVALNTLQVIFMAQDAKTKGLTCTVIRTVCAFTVVPIFPLSLDQRVSRHVQ